MGNYNNEIFGFGSDTNENTEQTTNFNYDSISGLGQSDYENEDLFTTEIENTTPSIFDNYYNQESVSSTDGINNVGINYVENTDLINSFNNESNNINPFIQNFDISQNVQGDNAIQNDLFEEFVSPTTNSVVVEPKMNFDPMTGQPLNPVPEVETTVEQPIVMPIFEENIQVDTLPEELPVQVVEEQVETFEPSIPPIGPGLEGFVDSTLEPEENSQPIVMPMFEENIQVDTLPEEIPVPVVEEQVETFEPSIPPIEPGLEGFVDSTLEPEENSQVTPAEPEITQEKIEISDTPIEELNRLTEYTKEKIEETDINSLFDRVSVNVKDASDLFRKNTDIKQKIDTRFEELKKLQIELEHSRKKQLDEINHYKTEVLEKLTEKKEEIERRLNILKETQASLEKEKKEFEEYKKKEQDNIDKVQKEVQSAYDDRREELNHIEDVLRKQKDSLDEERSQLSLDRIQYESDKNELANNLLKFNELVNSFTNGVNGTQG